MINFNINDIPNLWINRLMVILLNIHSRYSNVIVYDMTWDMIDLYHMIYIFLLYDSDVIWYQIWYDIWYDSGGFRGGRGLHPLPLLGQHIFLEIKMATPNIFGTIKNSPPPTISQILDLPVYAMVCLFIILKYPILQQQLWQCYNFISWTSCCYVLQLFLICLKIHVTLRRTLHFNARLVRYICGIDN